MADHRLFDLTGRKALVTGASRGIGRLLAEALAEAGADVAVTARDLRSLTDSMAALERIGCGAIALAADVTDVKASQSAIDQAAAQLDGLDILINNAGIEEIRPSFAVDEALWDRILATNLKGAFFCAQAAARHMRDAGGSIINLCSLTAEIGIPQAVPYGSAKSGLLGMTRALAVEWAPYRIRVNSITPGYFRTALTEVFYQNEAWQQAMLGKIPLGRFGRLEDLQGAALFLASDASSYVTGQSIAVDGGFLASI
jgi:NAD(P)-dependent dehydrogenase (short-subunit alcohol dehydrogenase family)